MYKRYFREAKEIATKGSKIRQHRIGAIGIRRDGVIVKSNNLPNRAPEPTAHAEHRLMKKMGYGGVVYVVRVLRNGMLTMAKPCKTCEAVMRFSGISKVYYSITSTEYGVLEL